MLATSRYALFALTAAILSTNMAFGQNPAQDRKTSNDIKQIALAYYNYVDANNNKAPTKAEDLGPFFENDKRLLELLKSGSLVFSYGVTPLQMTDGTSNTVLIYEKDAPTKGGIVGYGDGSVKKLSAEEFKKAIIAGKK